MDRARTMVARFLAPACSAWLCLHGLLLLLPLDPGTPSSWERLAPIACFGSGIALAVSHFTRWKPRRGLDTVLAPLLAVSALGWSFFILLRIPSLVAGFQSGKGTAGGLLTVLAFAIVVTVSVLGAVHRARTAQRGFGLALFLLLLGLLGALFVVRPNYYVPGRHVRANGWGFNRGMRVWVSETTFWLKPPEAVVIEDGPGWLGRGIVSVVAGASDRVACSPQGVLTVNGQYMGGKKARGANCEGFTRTLEKDEFLRSDTPSPCGCGQIVSRAEIVARVLSAPGPTPIW